MINKLKLKNFGTNKSIDWNNLSNINLIIGENGSGKSFLLKAMYCCIKTIEDYRRGDDNRNETEILSERLYWTLIKSLVMNSEKILLKKFRLLPIEQTHEKAILCFYLLRKSYRYFK